MLSESVIKGVIRFYRPPLSACEKGGPLPEVHTVQEQKLHSLERQPNTRHPGGELWEATGKQK